MKTYTIFKKRDGQYFKSIGEIYGCSNFREAKKEFAKKMTNDNWNQSNNVQWLDKDQDGVFETGFYDFNGGLLFCEETEKYDPNEAKDFLLVTKKDIDKGFNRWNEDVYTWAIDSKNNVKNL